MTATATLALGEAPACGVRLCDEQRLAEAGRLPFAPSKLLQRAPSDRVLSKLSNEVPNVSNEVPNEVPNEAMGSERVQRADAGLSRDRGLVLMVALPCLNEAKTVEAVIAGVPAEIPGIRRIEIVVIDDGSSDETGRLAARAGAQVVTHERNRGLGATFREAVDLALAKGADILVNIDGDGQFDAADIPSLVAPIVAGGADMVTASRFMNEQTRPEMPAIKRWGNSQVANIVALLTGVRFKDVSCGFRALSAEALLRLNLVGGFTYTQETFIELVFKQLNIVEIPVKVRGTREFGTSRVASNLPLYAFRALQIMLRAFIAFRPLVFFATLSALFAVPGFGLLLFLCTHYLRTGLFSPHIWSGFVGGSFAFLSMSTLVTGLVADMLVRIRLNQENSLYFLKSTEWRRQREMSDAAAGTGSP